MIRMLKYRLKVPVLPREQPDIYIELTNRCNYSCAICPLKDSFYPPHDMEFGLFKKIVDDIYKWNSGTKSLSLHVFGEPFLYPRIFEALDYIESRLKECKIYFSTNFSTVDKKTIERLFAPRLYNLNLGIWPDTLDEVVYVKQRGRDFSRVMENINYLIRMKRKYGTALPEFHIGSIVTKDNKKETGAFSAFWRRKLEGLKGTETRTFISHDWAGQISARSVIDRRPLFSVKDVCHMPFNEMAIFSNGDAGLCCRDVNHKIHTGNVKEEGLRSIWEGLRAGILREKMMSGSLDSFAPCKDCINYKAPFFGIIRKKLKNRLKQFKGHLHRLSLIKSFFKSHIM